MNYEINVNKFKVPPVRFNGNRNIDFSDPITLVEFYVEF